MSSYTETIHCLYECTNIKELIRLGAFVAMRDMSCAHDPPPRGQLPVEKKIYFVPLFRENASENTAFFFKCLILLDVTTQSQQCRHLTFYDVTIHDFT